MCLCHYQQIQHFQKNLKETDAFLGMYHDQVLPVLKALSFGNSINITLGVPIIRTSVDHGVAPISLEQKTQIPLRWNLQ